MIKENFKYAEKTNSTKVIFSKNILQEEYKNHENIYFVERYKIDGDWIEKGKPLYSIHSRSNLLGSLYHSSSFLAEKDGIVEFRKKKDDLIHEGELICLIHPLGSYPSENTPLKSTYRFYFDMFKDQEKSFKEISISMKEWFKQDGEFIHKGDNILSFSMQNEIINHYAEKEGYLEIIKELSTGYFSEDKNRISHNNLIYVIRDKEEHKHLFKNIPEIITDEFTGNKLIRWKTVGGNIGATSIRTSSLQNDISFEFTFNTIDNKDYIVFSFEPSKLKLMKDDVVSFLFEDGRIINFIINNPSYKISQYTFQNKVQITDNELLHFEKEKFLKWKIKSAKTSYEITGGIYYKYSSVKSMINLVFIIQKLAKEYSELVRTEIPNYKPLIERESFILSNNMTELEECYVYLMIDTINQYHKIGISNKPSWREKTLQSEKPSIELIASKKYVSRRIALSIEKAFHNTFADKRVRGEWFQLDEIEVEEIRITLTN